MTQEELNIRLEEHQAWLDSDCEDGIQLDLRGANLKGLNFENANLNTSQLQAACLIGANLSYADFNGANLSWADLSNANLSHANFQEAEIGTAIFLDNKVDFLHISSEELDKADINLKLAVKKWFKEQGI